MPASRLTSSSGKSITRSGMFSSPAVVISDVVMPRVSGPEMLRRMCEAGHAVKVLFTSGYTERDVTERATLDPGLPFLSKPWTVTDLLTKIREVLDAPAAAGAPQRAGASG